MAEPTARRRPIGLGLGAAGLMALGAGPAWSHAIESSLEHVAELNDSFRQELDLQSRFSTGEPAGAAAVRLLPPDGGTPVELGRTDRDGRLRFTLPDGATADWDVMVDAGPGHRDYLGLAEATGSPALATRPSSPSPAGPRSPLANWGRTAPGRLLAQRPAGMLKPLVGGLAMGLGASAVLVLGRRRRF